MNSAKGHEGARKVHIKSPRGSGRGAATNVTGDIRANMRLTRSGERSQTYLSSTRKPRARRSVSLAAGHLAAQGFVVSIRSLKAQDLPSFNSDGTSNPYLRISCSGVKEVSESTCIKRTLESDWHGEEFAFLLGDHVGSRQLTFEMYDREWIGPFVARPDLMGTVIIDIDESMVSKEPIRRWYPLQNDKLKHLDAMLHVEFEVTNLGSIDREGIWHLLDRRKRFHSLADSEKEREDGTVKVLIKHLRPIIANVMLILYAIVRPVFLLLTEHRSLLVEYKWPGLGILFHMGFYYSWWHESVIAFSFLYITGRFIWSFVNARNEAHPLHEEAEWKSMESREYSAAFAEAKFDFMRRRDPFSVFAFKVNNLTSRIGRNAAAFTDELFFYADPKLGGRLIAVLLGLTLFFLFLPAASILYYALRYSLLFLYVYLTILFPIAKKFPRVKEIIARLFKFPVTMWPKRVLKVKMSAKERETHHRTKTQAQMVPVSESVWKRLTKKLGTRLSLRKGDFLEVHGRVIEYFFRLESGRIEMNHHHGGSGSVFVVQAPATILAGNMLVGHGAVRYSFVVRSTMCKLVRLSCTEVREFIQREPAIGQEFFRYLATDLALELKLKTTSVLSRSGDKATLNVKKKPQLALLRTMSGIPQVNEPDSASPSTIGDLKEADLFCARFNVAVSVHHLSVFKDVFVRKVFKKRAGKAYITTSQPYYFAFWPQYGQQRRHGWVYPLALIVSSRMHKDHVELTFRTNSGKKGRPKAVKIFPATAQDVQEMGRLLRETIEVAQSTAHEGGECVSAALHGVEMTVEAGMFQPPIIRLPLFEDSQSVDDALQGMSDQIKSIYKQRMDLLTNEDRRVLLGGNEDSGQVLLKFEPGEVIMQESRIYEPTLFQVHSGMVQVWKMSRFVAALPEQCCFGEISYLLRDPSSATIKASDEHSSGVLLRRLSESYLNDLFEKHPGLGTRFFEFLCYLMINRLQRLMTIPRIGEMDEESEASSPRPRITNDKI